MKTSQKKELDKLCKKCKEKVYKRNYCFNHFKEYKSEIDKKYREKNIDRINKQMSEKYYNGGKKFVCKQCKKVFKRYRTTAPKYCSRKCFEIESKTSRKGKKNPAYRNGLRVNGKRGERTVKHSNACKEYKIKFLEKNDYIFCEFCKINQSLRFETHHIVFASEAPSHKNLHNERNLILVCIQCHNNFHKDKSIRKELVKQRKLKELFNHLK